MASLGPRECRGTRCTVLLVGAAGRPAWRTCRPRPEGPTAARPRPAQADPGRREQVWHSVPVPVSGAAGPGPGRLPVRVAEAGRGSEQRNAFAPALGARNGANRACPAWGSRRPALLALLAGLTVRACKRVGATPRRAWPRPASDDGGRGGAGPSRGHRPFLGPLPAGGGSAAPLGSRKWPFRHAAAVATGGLRLERPWTRAVGLSRRCRTATTSVGRRRLGTPSASPVGGPTGRAGHGGPGVGRVPAPGRRGRAAARGRRRAAPRRSPQSYYPPPGLPSRPAPTATLIALPAPAAPPAAPGRVDLDSVFYVMHLPVCVITIFTLPRRPRPGGAGGRGLAPPDFLAVRWPRWPSARLRLF